MHFARAGAGPGGVLSPLVAVGCLTIYMKVRQWFSFQFFYFKAQHCAIDSIVYTKNTRRRKMLSPLAAVGCLTIYMKVRVAGCGFRV